jgi:hypothetical protein
MFSILLGTSLNACTSLLVKYNDGYVDDESGEVQKGYPQEWLQDLVRQKPDRYLLQPSD